MEEKKELNEEKIAEASGGRHYAKGSKLLSPEKKEELMKSSVMPKKTSMEKLPKDFLAKVSGGMYTEDEEEEDDEEDECPYCGGPLRLYYQDNSNWVFYCAWCSRIIGGSDFWLWGDDDD